MCLCFKWVRAEVISKECGECILYESEGFEDRKSCCVLVEYGKNNQHESWAYFGIVVSEDEWSMPVNSRMCGCFPGSDHGACVSSMCITEGLSIAPYCLWPGTSSQAWCEPPGYCSNSPRVCQPENTSFQPLNYSRPLYYVLSASE